MQFSFTTFNILLEKDSLEEHYKGSMEFSFSTFKILLEKDTLEENSIKGRC